MIRPPQTTLRLRHVRSQVVRQLVAGGLKLAVARGALRLALAVVSTRLPGGLLFEMDALDSLTFLGISGRARNSGAAQPNVSARRAGRVNPRRPRSARLVQTLAAGTLAACVSY